MRTRIDELLGLYLKVDEKVGWSKFPPGWTHDSVVQFAKSLVKDGATEHGFFQKCVDKIKSHLDDPEGFCASVIDETKGHTMWRTGPKGNKKEK